ncbi:MAG: sulfate adenylyltransferase, large subunit [Gammaproteobacteria bacterium]|jgi:bifunctional enzyme CysN/CysC|nr:sulfate adenylyltransferase, large subunit [Gammaproteobacteria bacterium]MCE3238244.1 sulfate adenylyltransferase, large subunit [Gammaproteobacteria bacterium]
MQEELMNIVVVGHVDHGKSTIIGRLLADTHSLPQGKLEQVKANCERNSKPFEYAFLLDALKDEQAQGITIDLARCFFKTSQRKYLILDAPGHSEFLKNMITGAAHAEAALLVIDANEGIQENSKRHAYMLSMLGIKQLLVVVNKMDLIQYSQEKFNRIVADYRLFLNHIGLTPVNFIPVSGMQGDSIVALSKNIPWYQQQTVLETIDSFQKSQPLTQKAFRMPVQDIYKFTKKQDDRRIVAGRIESGQVSVGDKVIFYPSGKMSTIASIEAFNAPKKLQSIEAGYSIGFTLAEQIYIKRGDLLVKEHEQKPEIASRIQVSLFWLGKSPLVMGKEYYLKLGTTKVRAHLEKVLHVMNAASLESKASTTVQSHEVAVCLLKLHSPIAFDRPENNELTSRFVLVDNYDIAGGGIIQHALEDNTDWMREKIQERNANWITSDISREERAEKYGQYPSLIIITGQKGSGRKTLAKSLERALFAQGKKVYYLGIGNVIYGVDADIKNTAQETRIEHLRRFSEVLNILLDAGQIVIITALNLTQDEVNFIKEATLCQRLFKIWMGQEKTTDIQENLWIKDKLISPEELVNIQMSLKNKINVSE